MRSHILLGLVIAALASPSNASEKLRKVVWLTTTSNVTKSDLEAARSAVGRSEFQYFKLDETKKILTYFENQFPKELLNRSDKEKNDYLAKNIHPRIKAYAADMMRSDMGVVLAKMYRLDRLPAVVINDKYITYGVSVEDSISAFKASR